MAMEETKKTIDIRVWFGITIRNRRHELGLSQKELAHRSGLNRTYISQLEQGTRNISLESAENLAEALKITLSELFFHYGANDCSAA